MDPAGILLIDNCQMTVVKIFSDLWSLLYFSLFYFSFFFPFLFPNGREASRKLSIVNYRLSIFLLTEIRQKKRTIKVVLLFKLIGCESYKRIFLGGSN